MKNIEKINEKLKLIKSLISEKESLLKSWKVKIKGIDGYHDVLDIIAPSSFEDKDQSNHYKVKGFDKPLHQNDIEDLIIDKLKKNEEKGLAPVDFSKHVDVSPEKIHRGLDSNDKMIRMFAIKHPSATPEHIDRALDDKDMNIRNYAIQHPSATPENIDKALNDEKMTIRRTAMKHPNATSEHIGAGINSDDIDMRIAAIQHPNATTEHISAFIENPNFKNIYNEEIDALLSRNDLTKDHLQKIITARPDKHRDVVTSKSMKDEDFDDFLSKNPVQDEIHVSPNTHKLRKLRDFIQESGGSLSKKDIEKEGFNLKSLGVDNKVSPQGKLDSKSLTDHIESLPKLKYTTSEDTYGEDGSEFDWSNLSWSDFDEEAFHDVYDHELDNWYQKYPTVASFIDGDYDTSFENEFSDLYNEYKDLDSDKSFGEFIEEKMKEDPDLENEVNDHIEELRSEIIRNEIEYNPISEYKDFLTQAGYKPNIEVDYNTILEPHVQKHTPEPSKVFQLNLHPSTIRKLKQEDLYDDFKDLYDDSFTPHHPAGEEGLGWARYTEADDGIHIDEIQSDFGQGLSRKISKIKKDIRDGFDSDKDELNKLEKINKIIFADQKPSQIIHDSFLQHLRNKGHHDKNVHIWDTDAKHHISLGGRGKPPVHMMETYGKQPKSMGYQSGNYGEISTQYNPIAKGWKTHKEKVRKSDISKYYHPSVDKILRGDKSLSDEEREILDNQIDMSNEAISNSHERHDRDIIGFHQDLLQMIENRVDRSIDYHKRKPAEVVDFRKFKKSDSKNQFNLYKMLKSLKKNKNRRTTELHKAIPKGTYIFYSDLDSAGSLVEKAVMSDEIEKIKDISNRISLALDIIKYFVNKLNGTLIVSGGDDSAAIMPIGTEGKLQLLKETIKKKTGFTVTIGYGKSSPNAITALIWGKTHGKNQVVAWDAAKEKEIKDTLKPQSPEDKAREVFSDV